MLNETELKIIAAFFPEGTERATKEIENRSGYSHERVYSTLAALEKKELLTKKKVGKTLVYSIAKFNDAIYLGFAYYSIDKKEQFIKKYPLIWNALEEFMNKSKPELAILFGSYSKGEAKERSDIDILCIGEGDKIEMSETAIRNLAASARSKKTVSEHAQEHAPYFSTSVLDKIALSLRHKYAFKISPAIVKKNDFKNIKTENPEFWSDIINLGIVLKGQELFYELVYG